MRTLKKRIASLLLACILCVGLFPVSQASAINFDVDMPDVFQGKNCYVTVSPYTLKNNTEGWKLQSDTVMVSPATMGFVNGYTLVTRKEVIKDDHGYELYTRTFYNYADRYGNLLDLSDLETPPSFGPTVGEPFFSEGLCPFYDYKAGLWGYMDTEGKVVLEPQYASAYPFHDGLARVATPEEQYENDCSFIDPSGKVAFSVSYDGAVDYYFSHGLVAFKGNLSGSDYFVGFLDHQGKPAITIYHGPSDGYSTDEYLSVAFSSDLFYDYSSAFSDDGYAILKDYRGGRRYPAYVVIDTSGKEVGVLDVDAPQYVSVSDRVREGYIAAFIHGNGPMEKGGGYVFDIHGNLKLPVNSVTSTEPIGCGVASAGTKGDGTNPPLLIDTDGNIVIPTFTPSDHVVRPWAEFLGFFSDNIALMYYLPENGSPRHYLLEVHPGTYTGPRTVYHSATGAVTGNGTTINNTPSSWAEEQVHTAISAGLVPGTLQYNYTSATTRAEFCALAVKLYETVKGTTITERAFFTDTTDVNVEKMGALGVVSGAGNGRFNPNGALTREQAAVMLANLANAIGKPLATHTAAFADNGSISSWATDAVGRVQGSGIMGGVSNNKFSPRGSYTREQSIITILRLYDAVK